MGGNFSSCRQSLVSARRRGRAGGSTTAGLGNLWWGPTIVALALDTPVPQAVKYFVYVSATAMLGSALVALIVQRVGGRPVGIVFGFVAAVALGFARYFHAVLIAGFPLFVVLIAVSASFVEGGAQHRALRHRANTGSGSGRVHRSSATPRRLRLDEVAGAGDDRQRQRARNLSTPGMTHPNGYFTAAPTAPWPMTETARLVGATTTKPCRAVPRVVCGRR